MSEELQLANDPGGIIGWLKDNHPDLYIVLWSMDKVADGLLFNDPDHTVSYHVAKMAQAGNPFGILVCRALDVLSPNHCQWALTHELAEGSESLELAILKKINQIWSLVQLIAAKEGDIMSVLSDLQAADAAITAAIQGAIALIQQLQAGGVANADVEKVVADLTAAAGMLNAAVIPPPAPTPNP